jgi:hypothetical protein
MNKIRQGPVQPLYIEDWTPYYSRDDCDIHGYPEVWGVMDYGIVDGQAIDVPKWVPENKVHYYDRVDRFRMILYQLLALSGKVDWRVVVDVKRGKPDLHPDRVWNSIRGILKMAGHTRYYNRIPMILSIMQYPHKIDWGGNDDLVDGCMDDFRRMSRKFDEVGVGYFPNLRFTALRIMHMNGFEFGYTIPLLRTGRKIDGIIDVFNEYF